MTDREFLADLFRGLPEGFVDAVLGMVMSVIVLLPGDPADEPSGLSHIGGVPVMSEALDWPRPGLGALADDIASRTAEDWQEALAAHLRADVPLAFVAQIDLAELVGTEAAQADLPDTGRLLFFVDPLAVPFHADTRVGRVIWDQTAAEAARPRPLPPEITEAEARYIAEAAVMLDRDSPRNQAMEEILRQAGLSEAEIDAVFAQSDSDIASPFQAPRRGLVAELTTVLPAIGTLEFDRLAPPLVQAATAAPFDPQADVYFADAYTEALWGWPEHDEPLLQLLGPPLPEQDDPRYTAVIVTEYGTPFLDPEDWVRHYPRLRAASAEWRLLLQMPLSAWSQAGGEGTVYFLIRAEDLSLRRFDRVVAVYQQT